MVETAPPTFRTPADGAPVHVELTLDGFRIGVASVDAVVADHGLRPELGGRPVEIVLWTDDTNRDYARLTAAGAPLAQPAARFPGGPPLHLGGGPGWQSYPARSAP